MDFNNDSLLDIISGDRNGYVNYFRRLPGGELTAEPAIVAGGSTILFPQNSAPHVVDWNEDGLLDLLLANSDVSPMRIRLYLNSGTPEAYLFTTYSELTAGGAPIGLSRCNPNVIDLNMDGAKDLVCGEDLGRIFYYENTGTNAEPVFAAGVMLEAEGIPIQWPSGYTDLKVWATDWNEDGTPDLVVGNYEDSVHLYIAYPPTGASEESANRLDPIRISPTLMRDEVHVAFSTVRAAPALVQIFDAHGRLVGTLLSGTLPAGNHSVRWDRRDGTGTRVNSGAYFVRLTAEGTARSAKVIAR